MLGKNCLVFGCGLCRRIKGIGIWKFFAVKSDFYKKWRFDWFSVNIKVKVMNKFCKELIVKDRVYICERYFVFEYLMFVFSFVI